MLNLQKLIVATAAMMNNPSIIEEAEIVLNQEANKHKLTLDQYKVDMGFDLYGNIEAFHQLELLDQTDTLVIKAEIAITSQSAYLTIEHGEGVVEGGSMPSTFTKDNVTIEGDFDVPEGALEITNSLWQVINNSKDNLAMHEYEKYKLLLKEKSDDKRLLDKTLKKVKHANALANVIFFGDIELVRVKGTLDQWQLKTKDDDE